MKSYSYVLGVILVINYVHTFNLRIDPLVLSKQGLVRGQRATDGDYTTFLGVPYAVVDEDNPFGPATPHTEFEEEIFNAYDGSIRCPQSSVSQDDGTEPLDCLRLNIYVPNEATSTNPLPVLVWVHGGGFNGGSGGMYGPRGLVKEGVVVVTVNYRLGPYGFMCLDVPTVPGNQGLKDQHDALRWVKDNIASFGGNPYNVTLAGQSAGSCSILLHLYSPKEKLFHKLIAESGTPKSYGMFVKADLQAAVKLANHLGLNTTDTKKALEFLATAPPNLVVGAVNALQLILRPCTEMSFAGVDNFVDSNPDSLSNEKKVRNTPIMIGHTSKEEINYVSRHVGYLNSDPFYNNIVNSSDMDVDTLNRAATTVRRYYIGDSAISEEMASKLEEFESDFVFNHPIQRMITLLLKENANPVYEYMFSYVGNSEAEGAGHSAELKYLFDGAAMPGDTKKTEQDEVMSEQIIALWTNFIKFGNPTPRNDNRLAVTWIPVTSVSRPYMVIDKTLEMKQRVYNERMAFWDLYYDYYGAYTQFAR